MVAKSKQAGFTLIELMVVVVIAGILAAFAIPNFLQYRAQAMQAEARTNLAGIFVAEMSFFTERKEFGNFTDIGFALAGPGTNRYTYRTGVGLGLDWDRTEAICAGRWAIATRFRRKCRLRARSVLPEAWGSPQRLRQGSPPQPLRILIEIRRTMAGTSTT